MYRGVPSGRIFRAVPPRIRVWSLHRCHAIAVTACAVKTHRSHGMTLSGVVWTWPMAWLAR
jgi:hypothetical protein